MNSLATLRWNHGGRNVSSPPASAAGRSRSRCCRRPACRVGDVQHQEDRRIRMVEADRADRVEAAQVVFVRRVVAVPRDHVERRMVRSARATAGPGTSRPARTRLRGPRTPRRGVRKSRGLARPLRADRARDPAGAAARRSSRRRSRAPRRRAARRGSACRAGSRRSPAARRRARPSSVAMRRRPCCGTISSSPSAS